MIWFGNFSISFVSRDNRTYFQLSNFGFSLDCCAASWSGFTIQYDRKTNTAKTKIFVSRLRRACAIKTPWYSISMSTDLFPSQYRRFTKLVIARVRWVITQFTWLSVQRKWCSICFPIHNRFSLIFADSQSFICKALLWFAFSVQRFGFFDI